MDRERGSLPAGYFNSRPHGGRLYTSRIRSHFQTFQLTPSRRATLQTAVISQEGIISTHALTEGDTMTLPASSAPALFQLTPSRRATEEKRTLVIMMTFQLTPSRRATRELLPGIHLAGISTHALTEGDRPPGHRRSHPLYFNSRPHGGRRLPGPAKPREQYISTHALTEGD